MQEEIIEIENFDPAELFGPNNAHISLLKKYFGEVKIIARGNRIKLIGAPSETSKVIEKIERLKKHLHQNNVLTAENVMGILDENIHAGNAHKNEFKGEDVIVYGNSGAQIRARTPNQKLMFQYIDSNDLLFAIGPAGTGKTYTAVALAVRALRNKEVKRIILTRPAVEAGENLGFLPGDLKEKLDPYLQPLYDALRDMIPIEKLNYFLETGVIQIAPLAFMRGRTLDQAFVILDEAQNATVSQLKMFLTRMGQSAKFIITGDMSQVDLPKNQRSGLSHANDLLQNIPGIAFVHLGEKDVLRHNLVKKILTAYENQ